MTEPDEDEIEWLPGEEVYLPEDTCWVADPEFLLPDSGVEGVLAMQYRGATCSFWTGPRGSGSTSRPRTSRRGD